MVKRKWKQIPKKGLLAVLCLLAVFLPACQAVGKTPFHLGKERIYSISLRSFTEDWNVCDAENVSKCVNLLDSFQYRSTKTVNPGRLDDWSNYVITFHGADDKLWEYYISPDWSAILVDRTWYYGTEGCLEPIRETMERAAECETSSEIEALPTDLPTGSGSPSW